MKFTFFEQKALDRQGIPNPSCLPDQTKPTVIVCCWKIPEEFPPKTDKTTGSPSDCWMKLVKQVAFPRLKKVSFLFEWNRQWATKVVETWNDAFRCFSICSILFASSVNSLIPPAPSIQCCVGAVVCVVEEIENCSGGNGGKCGQDAQKSNFTTKCLNAFVAHWRLKFVNTAVVIVVFVYLSERSSAQSFVYKGPQTRGPQNQPLSAGTRPTVLLDVPKEMRASIASYRNRYNKYLRDTSTHEQGAFDPWGLVNRYVCRIATVWRVKIESSVITKWRTRKAGVVS